MLLDSVRIGDASTLSVAQYEPAEELSLYPNPAQGRVYIEGAKAETAAISVYDVTGRQMTNIDYTNKGKSVVVNTTNLSNGSYYMYIEQENVITDIKNFIIYFLIFVKRAKPSFSYTLVN